MTGRRPAIGRPEAVRSLIERLEERYGRPEWAPRYDPTEELVCCILTQHTTDATAFPAFDKLRETYPTWQEVVDGGPESLAKVIQRVGLANQKSRSIVGCLKEIHARTGGYDLELLRPMPMLEARDWLMSLPGVGPKTASIVLSFAFGREAIPVDTHIFRVCKRLCLIDAKEDEKKAHDSLLNTVPEDLAYRFHVALIQHGRRVCRAPKPKCSECWITDVCCWYKANA